MDNVILVRTFGRTSSFSKFELGWWCCTSTSLLDFIEYSGKPLPLALHFIHSFQAVFLCPAIQYKGNVLQRTKTDPPKKSKFITDNTADNSGVPGKDYEVYCSHGGIDKDLSVLGYDAVSTDRSLSTFLRRFIHSYSESKTFSLLNLCLLFFCTLNMRQ